MAGEHQKKHAELVKKLQEMEEVYYGPNPEKAAPDAIYDALFIDLQKLEAAHPELISPSSPTQAVGHAQKNRQARSAKKRAPQDNPEDNILFSSVEHKVPMLSIENIYNLAELNEWAEARLTKDLKEVLAEKKLVFTAELKIDGLALSLHYAKGVLRQAVTRGNGILGDDVTTHIRALQNFPQEIPWQESIELRGELCFPIAEFKAYNAYLEQADKPLFANPRNAAASSIRGKSTAEFTERKLAIIIYDWVENPKFNSHFENLQFLKQQGFTISPKLLKSDQLEEITDFYAKIEQQRESLAVGIDGLVVKLDDLALRQFLGTTNKAPRWAKAWKFKEEVAKTLLLDVENSVAKTGKITPVAILQPVQLAGTVVKRATLYNHKNVAELDLYYQDSCFIKKGGDIIPAVIGVDKDHRQAQAKQVLPPSLCPACSSSLVASESGVDLLCLNEACPAKLIGRLTHFVSRDALNIEFLAEKQLELFIEKKFIARLSDIFLLQDHRSELLSLAGYGAKKVENILSGIEKSKACLLSKFIYALGIHSIGKVGALRLSLFFKSWQAFLDAEREDLLQVEEMGEKVSDQVLTWKNNPSNRQDVEAMFSYGLRVLEDKAQELRDFVITGVLSQPRSHYEERLKNAGFILKNDVTRKTAYLLAGENAGSKLEKAERLGVKVIAEQDLEKVLAGFI